LGSGSDRVVATISALSDPTNCVYTLSDKYGGQMLTGLLRGVFITSICAGLIAFHNSTERYFFCMGRENCCRQDWVSPIPFTRAPIERRYYRRRFARS
jgi:hypothetical protein